MTNQANASCTPNLATAGPAFYSYNNLSGVHENTCGQAAVATITDAFRLNPFHMPYCSQPPQGMADDGRKHFDNDTFVGEIYRRYPPSKVFGTEMSLREDILRALTGFGLRCEEAYPAAFSDGQQARQLLVNWLLTTRLPVIALVDIPQLGFPAKAYTLHWGIIYALHRDGVYMASWHMNFDISWSTFMKGWHCRGLPYPNNYYQIFVSRS